MAFVFAVSAETVHRLCNDRVMPVFTPGSNTRRLPTAVVTERVVIFFYHSATKEPVSPEGVCGGKEGGKGFRRSTLDTHLEAAVDAA